MAVVGGLGCGINADHSVASLVAGLDGVWQDHANIRSQDSCAYSRLLARLWRKETSSSGKYGVSNLKNASLGAIVSYKARL